MLFTFDILCVLALTASVGLLTRHISISWFERITILFALLFAGVYSSAIFSATIWYFIFTTVLVIITSIALILAMVQTLMVVFNDGEQ